MKTIKNPTKMGVLSKYNIVMHKINKGHKIYGKEKN